MWPIASLRTVDKSRSKSLPSVASCYLPMAGHLSGLYITSYPRFSLVDVDMYIHVYIDICVPYEQLHLREALSGN